jgi:uncharacterized protein YgiB involved in biofilm formation
MSEERTRWMGRVGLTILGGASVLLLTQCMQQPKNQQGKRYASRQECIAANGPEGCEERRTSAGVPFFVATSLARGRGVSASAQGKDALARDQATSNASRRGGFGGSGRAGG